MDFNTILLRDLNRLLEKGVDYNVLIQVGEEPNTKSFKAHSGILKARCPYFQTALSETWVKQEDGIIVFTKPNISAKVFEIVLRLVFVVIIISYRLSFSFTPALSSLHTQYQFLNK